MITKEQDDILKATYNPEGSALRDYQYKILDTLVAFNKFCTENYVKYEALVND